MQNYVKLYGSILDSSVWLLSGPTRLVWISMLAMADAEGVVRASVGGLAHRARVTREEVVDALHAFLAVDLDDRSGVDDGRRIRKVGGGWQVVNHRRYRDLRTPAQVAEAERKARWRQSRTVQGHAGRDTMSRTDPDPDPDPDLDLSISEADISSPSAPGSAIPEPAPSKPDHTRRVWDCYVAARAAAGLPGRTPLLTAKRRRHLRARLASFEPEDLERAIRVLFAPASWWRENAFTAPEYFCRSDEQVEKLLAREGFRPAARGGGRGNRVDNQVLRLLGGTEEI